MERSKIRDSDNTRTFYLAKFFIDYLLLLTQKDADVKEKGPANGHADGLSLGLVAEMAELDSVRFVFGRMRLTMDDRVGSSPSLAPAADTTPSRQHGQSSKPVWIASHRPWVLMSSIRRSAYSTQLLLLDAMSTSNVEEDVEVAEILQHQLYYNGDILDTSLTVISQYKDQSVACVESLPSFFV